MSWSDERNLEFDEKAYRFGTVVFQGNLSARNFTIRNQLAICLNRDCMGLDELQETFSKISKVVRRDLYVRRARIRCGRRVDPEGICGSVWRSLLYNT